MKAFKIVLFALALACLANGIIAQGSRPPECSSESGKWGSDDINCDFTCSGNGWELDCDTDSSRSITCKVDQDGQPDSADVYFTCSYSSGQAPTCDYAALNSVSDTCVIDTVKTVLYAWKPADDDVDNDD